MQHDGPIQRLRSGAAEIKQYRLYFYRGNTPHISLSHEFEAEDDERAIDVATAWLEGRRAELWCGTRMVTAWDERF